MHQRPLTRLPSACALIVGVLLTTAPLGGRQTRPATLPDMLESYLSGDAKLTSIERAALLDGQPITKPLPADPSREVAVFGAVWINAPPAKYVQAITDIEHFEKGPSFLITKRISDPPKLDDFAQFTLSPAEIADLKQCRVNACELKMSAIGLARIQKEVDWSKPTANDDAQRVIREIVFEYVNGYLESGNIKLAEYRDSERPRFVAQEFESMIDRMPEFTTYHPDLKRYLLDFPKATLPNSTSFLYWQETKFGLKPTLRINHVTIVEQPGHIDVVSKMLYASHYFWTALELHVLLPDPARGPGFWFVNVNRSRSDGLSGFVGTLIRGKVRAEAGKGMQAILASTKRQLESGQ
jgi:hypothetical protein